MHAFLRSCGLLARTAGAAVASAGPSSLAAAGGAGGYLWGASSLAAAAAPAAALPASRRAYIKVPVARNQIASALKDISRIMRADGIQAQLWDAQVFTRPAARRVNEAKASAARAASRKFRWSMGWVARRRERGF